jgi:carotenoid cleavage dioxygenase-like enzyme
MDRFIVATFSTAQTPFQSVVLDGPDGGVARVTGTFPDWLCGRLVRTAPAVFERNGWSARHWFDGLGMLFRFTVEGGQKVKWAQRLLDSEASRAAARWGRIPLASFASGNGRSFLRRVFQPIPRRTDNTNVNVVPMGPDWIAMTETDRQLSIDPETLATRYEVTYEDELPAGTSMTPHPLYDAERRLVVNVGVVRGAKPELVVYAHAPASRRRGAIGRWPTSDLPYVHSFGLSEDTALVVAHPMSYRPLSLLWSNRFVEHMKWRPEQGTRVVAFDRASGAATVHEAETLFAVHTVNAFRDGGDTVLDVLAYDDPTVMTRSFRVEHASEWANVALARLTRLRTTRGGSRARVERLSEERFELPSISSRARSRRHRFVWGAVIGPESQVVRVDVENATVRRYPGAGYVFGEPIFVPAPDASADDDGALLAVGCDPRKAKAKLVALDARAMEPLAEAEIDVPLPLGFHGSFQSTSEAMGGS